jgi:hypothetical protein
LGRLMSVPVSINPLDPNGLTTPTQTIARVKYFPIEVTAVSLLPSTHYTAIYNGVVVNAFCKPFGGVLGQQLISNPTGQLLFQFLMGVPYNQTYLVNNGTTTQNGISLSTTVSTLQLQDPNGNLSTTYLPINLKM